MRLSSIFLNPHKDALGVDFSGADIRFVQVRRRSKNRFELVHFGTVTLPPGSLERGRVANARIFTRAVQTIINPGSAAGRIRSQAASIAVPERDSFMKELSIPTDLSGNLGEAVRWEALQHIPFELDELNLDWETVHSDQSGNHVLVAAIPRKIAEGFTDAVEAAGITVLALEPVSLSLIRLFAQYFRGKKAGLILHLGELESIAIWVEDSRPIFTASLPMTVIGINSALQSRFQLSPAESAKARRHLGFSPTKGRGEVRSSLEEILSTTVQRLMTIEEFYQDHFPNPQKPEYILISGPGSSTADVDIAISKKIKIPVSLAQPPANLVLTRRTKGFLDVFRDFAAAYGCGIRT
ncbi:MAG: pilus assembly protein PilM [Candidatus Kerfeldbacteria bacterium]|nr:pilus assembly protein PilM [Candidatus Kerfeldbacteria bacterium]